MNYLKDSLNDLYLCMERVNYAMQELKGKLGLLEGEIHDVCSGTPSSIPLRTQFLDDDDWIRYLESRINESISKSEIKQLLSQAFKECNNDQYVICLLNKCAMVRYTFLETRG